VLFGLFVYNQLILDLNSKTEMILVRTLYGISN